MATTNNVRRGTLPVVFVVLAVFALLALVAVLYDPGGEDDPVADEVPAPFSAAVDTDPDTEMAPLESAEGAVGTVPLPNAGGAVNPITPTGEMGGPAGQTPAYGEPGGAPSMVRP